MHLDAFASRQVLRKGRPKAKAPQTGCYLQRADLRHDMRISGVSFAGATVFGSVRFAWGKVGADTAVGGMRTCILMRSHQDTFSRSGQEKEDRTHKGCGVLFGLPDTIRTCGLKSRSLALYPAGLRADMAYLFASLIIVAYSF